MSLGIFVAIFAAIILGLIWFAITHEGAMPIIGPDQSGGLGGFSDDDWQTAALRIVPHFSTSASWCGGTVEQCDRVLAEIAKAREQFSAYEPPRMRRAIMGWLDYFEHDARNDRADCVSQKSRKELDEYRASRQAERDRVGKLTAALSARRGQ